MFRPIPAIIRFTSESVLVFIRFMGLCEEFMWNVSRLWMCYAVQIGTDVSNKKSPPSELTSQIPHHNIINIGQKSQTQLVDLGKGM